MIDKRTVPAYPARVSVNRTTGEIEYHQFEDNGYNHPGMTLRDHFAGLAMQGYISDGNAMAYTDMSVAERAYRMADAMLEARDAN